VPYDSQPRLKSSLLYSSVGSGPGRHSVSHPRASGRSRGGCPVANTGEADGSRISFVVEYGSKRVLFGTDAHADVLTAGLAQLAEMPCRLDACKLPHHGSKVNVTVGLIEALDCPLWLVSSNGVRFRHPDDAALARVVLKGVRGDQSRASRGTTGASAARRSPRRSRRTVPATSRSSLPARGWWWSCRGLGGCCSGFDPSWRCRQQISEGFRSASSAVRRTGTPPVAGQLARRGRASGERARRRWFTLPVVGLALRAPLRGLSKRPAFAVGVAQGAGSVDGAALRDYVQSDWTRWCNRRYKSARRDASIEAAVRSPCWRLLLGARTSTDEWRVGTTYPVRSSDRGDCTDAML